MWSENEKNILNEILDQLIPAKPERNIPSAGQLGIASFIFEIANKSLNFKDDIIFILDWTLSKADKISPCLVRKLEKENPKAFGSLLTETYKGYYSRPDIRHKLGLSKKPVHPSGYLVESENNDYLAQITNTVRARGPVYRDPTGGR